MIEERWTEIVDVRLHYLLRNGDEKLVPLLYMPGFLQDSESFRAEMKRLAPRTVIGAGRRGVDIRVDGSGTTTDDPAEEFIRKG